MTMSAVSFRNLSKFSQSISRLIGSSPYCVQNVFFLRAFHISSIVNVEGMPITMPSLSPTMMEGTIVKWLKKEGDRVEPGDVLCDIQTDKAVISLETDEEGILAKILVGDNSADIKVGSIIALMVSEGEDWKNAQVPQDETKEIESIISKSPKIGSSKSDLSHYGPSVRLLLEKYGLTSEQVPALGPHGIVLKGDILKFIKDNNIQPKKFIEVPPPTTVSPTPSLNQQELKAAPIPNVVVSGDLYDDIELTNMRKTIAKRLFQSKSSIAHTYSTFECSMDSLLALRKTFKKNGIQVSVNDFIIKSVAVALTRCPEINSVWEGGQLLQKKEVDISVAVSTKAGLITPIVRAAESLGLEDISHIVRDLANRARDNKLKLDEFQGGTFTISNLGMFGIKEFTAIINPPQVAILAVGGSRLELGSDEKLVTRMCATLSYDQAAISDDTAAIFLDTLKEILENPQQMILGSYPKQVDHSLAALL